MELDPMPYRYLNNPNIRYDFHLAKAIASKTLFQPRKGYEQDFSEYAKQFKGV